MTSGPQLPPPTLFDTLTSQIGADSQRIRVS
jgi:hypothetical protein